MGCDADITIARIQTGVDLLDHRCLQFTIKSEDPVVFLPLWGERFGSSHMNITSNHDEVDTYCRLGFDDVQVLMVPGDHHGVVILQLSIFAKPGMEDILTESDKEFRVHSLPAGTWVLTRYSESGTEIDGSWSDDRVYHSCQKGMTLGDHVTFEIWT